MTCLDILFTPWVLFMPEVAFVPALALMFAAGFVTGRRALVR